MITINHFDNRPSLRGYTSPNIETLQWQVRSKPGISGRTSLTSWYSKKSKKIKKAKKRPSNRVRRVTFAENLENEMEKPLILRRNRQNKGTESVLKHRLMY